MLGRRADSARRAWGWIVLTAFAAGCEGVVTVEPQVEAVIRGTVLDEENVGVADVAVTARAYRDELCSGPVWHDEVSPSLTQLDGAFLITMIVPLSHPFRACLVLVAEPPPTAGLQPGSVSGAFVDFVNSGAVPDTAVVVVVLTEP